MNNREEKKASFTESKSTTKPAFIIVAVLFLAVIAATSFWLMSSPADAARYLQARDGTITIPLTDVNDGLAHYYKYKAGDETVSFFLLQSRDGVVRAALDACDVCYKALKGYRQEGDFMVCNNCNQKFQADMINVVKGGCNPAPLNRSIVDGQVVLQERELLDGRRYFPTHG